MKCVNYCKSETIDGVLIGGSLSEGDTFIAPSEITQRGYPVIMYVAGITSNGDIVFKFRKDGRPIGASIAPDVCQKIII